MIRSIFLVAGELSADRYAARLVTRLRERIPDLHAEAIGGPHLQKAGVPLFRDSSGWGAIGIAEAAKRFPPIWRGQQALKRTLRRNPPDLFIPIDFGAFNVPTAAYARSLGIPVCYAVPPGSWRPDGGRVSPRLAACADAFLTPFPRSEARLREAGLEAHCFGHPLLDFLAEKEPREALRLRLGLPERGTVVALLPGSRGQELQAMAPAMLQAARQLSRTVHDLHVVVPLAASLSLARFESILAGNGWKPGDRESVEGAVRYPGEPVLVVAPGQALDSLLAADAALVCSGTATLEAALAGCPMVIGYSGAGMMALEYLLRKAVVPDMIGLPNLLLGRKLCPELIASECSEERLLRELLPLLTTDAGQVQRQGFMELSSQLGEPGAIRRWAEYIVRRWGTPDATDDARR